MRKIIKSAARDFTAQELLDGGQLVQFDYTDKVWFNGKKWNVADVERILWNSSKSSVFSLQLCR